MKSALMYATTASMIQQFNMGNIRLLQELGFKVDVACNLNAGNSISDERVAQFLEELKEMDVAVYNIPISRSVFNVKALFKSIGISKKLMNEKGYSLIHCHTPIGSVVCRIANRLSDYYKKTKMIYTAHGFHFFKGAPKQNWLFYYPIEKFCSRFTDILLTINREDYDRAKAKFHAKDTIYIPGIGVDVERFSKLNIDKKEKRKELSLTEDAFVMLSVGELNKNKNHIAVIRALSQMQNNDIHYVVAGKGELVDEYNALAKELGIGECVHLLGYRTDIAELMKMSDLFVFPSFREGLPVSVIEAMSCGLPCVVTNIRGSRDLINGNGGFVLNVADFDKNLVKTLENIPNFEVFSRSAYEHNTNEAKKYSADVIQQTMRKVYGEQ